MFYASTLQYHEHYERLTTEFPTPKSRLLACIEGFPQRGSQRGLAPLWKNLENFDGWLNTPDVLKLRYEDLVGPRGGGSPEKQISLLKKITEFTNRPLDTNALQKLATDMWDPKSPTFRHGRTNEWPQHFDDEVRAKFKATAGRFVTEWGYADSDAW
jgi:hypothetical protein